MSKKEIQEERIRGYFIQATKEILKAEGLQRVSVRIVADKAGYSYATLYNYFKDVKDLIFECVVDFQQEIKEFINSQVSKDIEPGKERIKAISNSYVNYFLEYPGIFELFYIEKMSNLAGKKPLAELINSFLNELCSNDWEVCIKEKQYTVNEIELKKQQVNYTIIGLLLTYLHRHIPQSYQKFTELQSKHLQNILG